MRITTAKPQNFNKDKHFQVTEKVRPTSQILTIKTEGNLSKGQSHHICSKSFRSKTSRGSISKNNPKNFVKQNTEEIAHYSIGQR